MDHPQFIDTETMHEQELGLNGQLLARNIASNLIWTKLGDKLSAREVRGLAIQAALTAKGFYAPREADAESPNSTVHTGIGIF